MTDKELKKVLLKHQVYSDELFSDLSEVFELNLKPLEERKQEFIESLRPYVESIGREEINNFFKYWSETPPRGRKMRFEKEKSFEIPKRLETWMKNKQKFSIVNMLSSKKK